MLNFQDPPPQPTLVTRELEKAFADRDIQRRKNLPPVDPRGHTGVAAGATRAGAARDRRRQDVCFLFVFCFLYCDRHTVNLCQCMEKRLKKVSGELFVGKSCFHRLRTQKALLIKVSKSISRTLAVFLSILLKKSKYFQYFGTFSLKDRNTCYSYHITLYHSL